MAKKRLFQALDELNVRDAEQGSSLVGVCPTLVSMDYGAKTGTRVTMGVPGNMVFDVQSGKVMPVLLMVNRAEYENSMACPEHDMQGIVDPDACEALSMIGKTYQHYNGAKYKVIDVVNIGEPDKRDKHPITIIYKGDNGKRWSREFNDWARSFTELK